MDNQIIYDLLSEVREAQRQLDDKLVEHKEETLKWQAQADSRTERIEEDLRQHKEGVIQHREAMVIFNKRLEILEEPYKANKYFYIKLMKIFKFVAALGTAIGVITKYFKIW